MNNVTRRELLAMGGVAAAVGSTGASGQAPGVQTPAPPARTSSENPLPFTNLPGRSRVSLDGPWAYIVDPYDAAGRRPTARRSFWLDERAKPGGPLVEYEWASSPTMAVPTDWNSRVPELLWYDGPVYFRRTFAAAPAPAPASALRRRRFLAFEAVNYLATVWLNGVEIGRHEGGFFTPFAMDVTDKLRPGENAIVVRADSRHGPEAVPTDYTDWQNYGGITRSVWLVDLPATYLRDWFVRLEAGRIVADVRCAGPAAAGQAVTLDIPALKLRMRGIAGADGTVRMTAPVPRALVRWTPEAPRLHEVRIAASDDAQTDRIGFREWATSGRALLLNGKPIFLRGISIHEEPIGPVGTRAMTETQACALLTEAKALGCNFVRLAHYPHSEHTVRLADEMGLIVWAEVPVYWEDIAYDSPRTLALARKMLAELVTRDRNRAAVALWSVANETPITPARTKFLQTLIADVRALDPTRLVTAALNKNIDVGGAREGESRFMVEDALGASLDVIAVNEYEGWYGPRTPGQIAEVSFASRYEKPLVFSEFGADALAGHHGDKAERWTEEYQAFVYDETLKLVERTPGCVGCSPWVLKDFRSPRRWHPRFQNFWNRKGLISETGVHKLAYDVLRRYYAGKRA